jgi:hypothetical protein
MRRGTTARALASAVAELPNSDVAPAGDRFVASRAHANEDPALRIDRALDERTVAHKSLHTVWSSPKKSLTVS